MQELRAAAVAGQWYPGDPARLAREVDAHLAAAEFDLPEHPLRAIVAPHAGLMYSGPVAAYAYKPLQRERYGCVVLVGPSHFVAFRGVSIWPRGAWATPFGDIKVDSAFAAAIAAQDSAIVERPDAHGREHSLEMQLPFIAHLLPGVPIVPLVMGAQTRETAMALGDALARAVAARTTAQAGEEGLAVHVGEPWRQAGEVLLVASSDLSHYEDARTAADMDRVITARVDAFDPDGLMDALEGEPRHACGGGPMVAVLHAARLLGARHARVLRHADSGDVSGDKSSVVGYMAAAIW
jgi:predicted class III extradiol MEMO1 family dioxygenase